MTDAAIAADSGSAPADLGGAALNADTPDFGHALGSQIPPDAQAKPDAETNPVQSLDASLERAEAKIREKNAAKDPPKPDAKADAKLDAAKAGDKDAKPETKPTQTPERGDNGKFVAKSEASSEGARETPPVGKADAEAKPSEGRKPHHEPPAGFLQHAKEDWAKIPETVQEELHRRVANIEQGIQKHRQRAEAAEGAYEPYRELDEIAKQNGKHGAEVFREYFAMENHLRKDLVGGLEEICSRVGVSLRDVAAHVMGQTPEQTASAQDATIRELKSTIAELKQQVGTVAQTFQQQQQQATAAEVATFAKEHPRFEEIADDIAFFLKTRTNDLSEAYALAERLNPAPAQVSTTPPEASSAPVIDLQAQTQKGGKSINGAPSAGSTPAAKKRSMSIDESLDRAFGRTG